MKRDGFSYKSQGQGKVGQISQWFQEENVDLSARVPFMLLAQGLPG